MAHYWGLDAIAGALGLKTHACVLNRYWQRGLPMMKRRKGRSIGWTWWTTDQMLTPWLMQQARQGRKEALATREKRARVKSGNGKAALQSGSSPPPDVVVPTPPADATDAK